MDECKVHSCKGSVFDCPISKLRRLPAQVLRILRHACSCCCQCLDGNVTRPLKRLLATHSIAALQSFDIIQLYSALTRPCTLVACTFQCDASGCCALSHYRNTE